MSGWPISTSAGAPLLAVLDDSELDVAMVVPAGWLSWLKAGQPFTLVIDGTRRSASGTITRLGAQVDPVSQMITVYGRVADPPPDLVSGMSATAIFPAPS